MTFNSVQCFTISYLGKFRLESVCVGSQISIYGTLWAPANKSVRAEVSIHHLFGNLCFEALFIIFEYVNHQEALGNLVFFHICGRHDHMLKVSETPPFAV